MPRYTATPLFNGALDLAINTQSPIIIDGQRYSQYIDGWKPGVPLKPSILGTIAVEAADEREAAEKIFMVLNRDDRPNGREEPSLSVGDVVIIHTHDSDVPFSVQFIGFRTEDMFAVDEALVRH